MKIKLGFGILASATLMAGCNPYGGDNFVEILSHKSLNNLSITDANDKTLLPSSCKINISSDQFCKRYPLPQSSEEFIKVKGHSDLEIIVGANTIFPESSPFSMVEASSWIFGGQSQTVRLYNHSGPKKPLEKLSAAGELLPDDASNWACFRDTTNGNVWENKNTDASSIHYASHDISYWDGSLGIKSLDECGNGTCDTASLIAQTNAEALCGLTNWSLPSQSELFDISIGVDITFPYYEAIPSNLSVPFFSWTNKTLPFIPDTTIGSNSHLVTMPIAHTPGYSDYPYVVTATLFSALQTAFIDPSLPVESYELTTTLREMSDITTGAILISRPE